MERYVLPSGGDAAGGEGRELLAESAEYSLSEQVMRTSESVERLADSVGRLVELLAEGKGAGRAGL